MPLVFPQYLIHLAYSLYYPIMIISYHLERGDPDRVNGRPVNCLAVDGDLAYTSEKSLAIDRPFMARCCPFPIVPDQEPSMLVGEEIAARVVVDRDQEFVQGYGFLITSAVFPLSAAGKQ